MYSFTVALKDNYLHQGSQVQCGGGGPPGETLPGFHAMTDEPASHGVTPACHTTLDPPAPPDTSPLVRLLTANREKEKNNYRSREFLNLKLLTFLLYLMFICLKCVL